MKTSNKSFSIILNVHLYIYRAKEKAKQNAMYQYQVKVQYFSSLLLKGKWHYNISKQIIKYNVKLI